ncbi:probable mitochondrial import inner membrane translocase subunit TIM21 isoform X2 [Magnolia sinica]|uniref:probable mitochondrial import inner membrane translocase subunit TIM21 isoform X2 n=1 Tax=Magnolia sinica TaxID=86752 RepID=UPI002658160C|nr:probable mitochondrial import inner membrane translocase subunit TIM21 isoform X2 [Magnolia sinica]
MNHLKYKLGEFRTLVNNRWTLVLEKSPQGSFSPAELLVSNVGSAGFSSTARNAVDTGRFNSVKKDMSRADCRLRHEYLGLGFPTLFRGQSREHIVSRQATNQFSKYYGKHHMLPCLVRAIASSSASQSSGKKGEEKRKDISTIDDPFDAPTYNIPEKPVSFTEGASYSLIILAGLGIAGAAAYAVFKELIFEPKEYKIFGKALERVQNDSQVRMRVGSPVTGYGQESRNRAARQRIPHRTWTDEDGVEHVEVNFHIRGPHGAGKVYTEMFKDKTDKQWKFTYLIVEIQSPSPAQLMLESYVPA